MRNVTLVVTLMASCVCSMAEETFPVRAKEYFMAVLRGNKEKETKEFS